MKIWPMFWATGNESSRWSASGSSSALACYLPKSPVYLICSLWHHTQLLPQCLWCTYTSRGEFFLLVQLLSPCLQFLRCFILLWYFHLNCIIVATCVWNQPINFTKFTTIHIELASFQNMSETKMQPWIARPLFFSVSSILENKWLWNVPVNFNPFSFCVMIIIVYWLFIF